jgi:hypothetical protein
MIRTPIRSLSFILLDELLHEVERCTAAEARGTLVCTGNWSLGTILGHLAAWIDYAYDGYPFTVPWPMRLLGPLLKGRMVRGPLRAGVRIPGIKGGTVATQPMETAQGEANLRRAIERLRALAPVRPNPLLGPLTHAQWISLHCAHAALHLGYVHPQSEM